MRNRTISYSECQFSDNVTGVDDAEKTFQEKNESFLFKNTCTVFFKL